MSKTVRIPRRSRAGILAAIILGICLLLLLTVGVLTVGAADAHPPRLVDNAGLLSQAEADSLRATLDQYSEELNFDIVVVTTNTLDGKTPRDYADDYFDYNGYGYGANRDGALFLRYINGSSKEVWLSTSGEGIKAIRDADIESIFDDMEDDIRANRYGAAFQVLAQDVRDEVLDYRSYDTIWIFVGLAVGLGVGLIATNAMRSSLKSVRQQRYAGSYIKGNSVNITEARDIFLYRTVSRVAKPKESSGGGSSTHTSSSGRSHGGGGRSM